MWPSSWVKSSSSPKKSNTPKHKFQSSNFRCSSFKDIENLCNIQDFDLDFSPNTPIKRQPSTPTQTQTQTPTRTCRSVFHRVRTANSLLQQWANRSDPTTTTKSTISGPKPNEDSPKPPSPESRIVVYYTSLRVIRPTFEACRSVMAILQGFQVVVDERDISMDLGFMSELRELLGLKPVEQLSLPRVFIGGRYIGGADEVKYLNEIGELKKLVSGLPQKKPGTCVTCGGYRFILCAECSGSHKIFSEKVGFRSCMVCNENGLIRCPDCSSPPLLRPILAPINAC